MTTVRSQDTGKLAVSPFFFLCVCVCVWVGGGLGFQDLRTLLGSGPVFQAKG